MFYSHEVLTSRKHGVATIWLVATLGARSQVRKVDRKAILGVDVPEACHTIIDPSAPMALRLQGSLLYGVSRVYSQQCGYVLSDLQSFRDKLRSYAIFVGDSEIDIEVGRARPGLMNLPDDPAFLPELNLDLDLSLFNIPTEFSRGSSIISPAFGESSAPSERTEDIEEPQLVFPSADTPVPFSAGAGFGTSSAIQSTGAAGRPATFEELGVIEDPLFDVDDAGEIVHLPTAAEKEIERGISLAAPGDTRATSRTSAGTIGPIDLDFDQNDIFGPDLPVHDDHHPFAGPLDEPVPDAIPLSLTTALAEVHPSSQVSDHNSREQESSITAEAPQRRARHAKQLVADQQTELGNRELARWNEEYLANMAQARKEKKQHKSLLVARKAAAFWVLRQGIGNQGPVFADDVEPHPLSVFTGQALLDALTGSQPVAASRKRSREALGEHEPNEDDRHVRARTRSDEEAGQHIGRGVEPLDFDFGVGDDFIMTGDDLPPSEVGRQAPPSLPDRSSQQMRWNVSAWRHGSLRLGSVLPHVSSSVRGLATGMDLGPPSVLGHRDSRFTTPSPLLAKSTHLARLSRVSSLEIASRHARSSSTHGTDELQGFDERDLRLGANFGDDFELYGPSALVSPQQAAQSQWAAATLDSEAQNFLLFLDTQIKDKMKDVEDDREDVEAEIVFEELLPRDQNSPVVASQAFIHVLALATKNLIKVEQEEPFGAIKMSLLGEATVAEEQERHEEGEEGGGDEMTVEK